MVNRCLAPFALICVLLASASTAHAQAADPQAIEFFEQKIRPVLVEQCYACHSVEARNAKKLKGGLLLDTAAGVLNGGESGPAIVAGKPAESLLIKALKYDGLEMPPNSKLADAVVADFVKWIELGAPDPRQGDASGKPKREINLEEGRKFWSFLPLRAVTPPEVKRAEWSWNAD